MTKPILITGATGNVGSQIVSRLNEQGHVVRAAIISENEIAKLPPNIDYCLFDFTDPTTYKVAFENVEKMFLMRPPHISNIQRDMKPAMRAATEHGVKHMVFLSLLGAEKNKVVPHAKVEKLFLDGEIDVAYTLLRCGFFMQNLSTTHLADIRDHDDIFIPAGKGKTAFIDVRDIAAVAALTLTQPGHENQAYPLTGSEAFDYYEVATLMTEIVGRPIRYSSPSPPRFAWRKWREGLPLPFVGVMSAIYLTTRMGKAKGITPDTAELLGRSPKSLRQFVEDFANLWIPE